MLKPSRFIKDVLWVPAKISVDGKPHIIVVMGGGVAWAYPARGSFEYACFHRVRSPGSYYNTWFKMRKGGVRVG